MKVNIVKRLYFLLLLLALPGMQSLFAQSDVVTLNSATNSGEAVAKQKVSMTTNFSSKPAAPQRFNAYIDQSAAKLAKYTSEKTTNISIGSSDLPLGATRVVSTVSATGAATCQIPIAIPQGTAGVQPSLALVYSSQSGSGIAGMGWNISGVSSVTRVARNWMDDDCIGTVNFDANDRFAIDGQRLLAISGSYGADGTVYETKMKNFATVTQVGVNPTSFTVLTKDGTRLNYGSQTDAQVTLSRKVFKITSYSPLQYTFETVYSKPFQWLLKQSTDANGNYMQYSYQTLNGQTVLSSVDYTGNVAAPYNSVKFLYTTKSDAKLSYMNSWQVVDKELLSEIQVYSQGQMVRRYVCSYGRGANNKTQLSSVTEYGAANTAIGITSVNWGVENNIMFPTSPTVVDGDRYRPAYEKKWTAGDVDNDGVSELISIYSDNGRGFVDVYGSSKSAMPNFDLNYYLWNDQVGEFLSQNKNPLMYDGTYSQSSGNVLVANINKDNQPDILVPIYTYNSERKEFTGMYFWYANAPGKINGEYITIPAIADKYPSYSIADINNDGLDEIVVVGDKVEFAVDTPSLTTGRWVSTIYIFYPTDNDHAWEGVPSKFYSKQATLHDIFSKSEKIVPKKTFINDYNADGLKDLMIVHDKGFNIYLNKGTSAGSKEPVYDFLNPITSTLFNGDYSFIREGDFNGDGAIDFVVNEHCNSNWWLLLNNGSCGFSSTAIGEGTGANAIGMREESFTGLNDDEDNCIVMDFNGDGKSDIIVFDYGYDKDETLGMIDDGGVFSHNIITWYKSTGSGFEKVINIEPKDENYSRVQTTALGDFNGDGRLDILTYGGSLHTKANQNAFNISQSINSGNSEGLVTKVGSSAKNYVSFSYQLLTQTASPSSRITDKTPFFTKSVGAKYPLLDIQPPLFCVGTTTQPDALGNESFTDYCYGSAQMDLKGGGFLGFLSTKVYNYTANQKATTTTTQLDATNSYLPAKLSTSVSCITCDEGGTELSNVVRTFTNKQLATKQYTSYCTNLEETDCFGAKTVTVSSFDNNGNPTSSEITYRDASKQTTSFSGYVAVGGSAVPSRAQTVTVSRKHVDDANSFDLTTNFIFDAKGNLTTKVSNVGVSGKEVTTTYSDFTPHGLPRVTNMSAASEGGNVSQITTTTYDAYSRYPLSVTDNTAAITTDYLYDPVTCNKLSETSLGLTTKYEYDKNLGLLVKVIDPRGNTVTTDYQPIVATGGYSITKTPSYGQPSTTTYDAWGKVLSSQTKDYAGAAVQTSNIYNANGSIQKTTSSLGGTTIASTSYTYYASHGKVKTEKNDLSLLSTSYDYAKGSVAKTVDVKKTTTLFDSWGNPTKVTDAESQDITYSYYSCGKVNQILSPGYGAAMKYDELGNQKELFDRDAGQSFYRYDALGRLTYQKLPTGDETRLYYDTKGRLSYKKNIATGDVFESYEYETSPSGYGKIKSVTNQKTGAKEEYVYDQYGQLTKHTKTIDQSISPLVFQYQYDNYGNNTGITYPGGRQIDRTFTNGRLTKVKFGTLSLWELTAASASKYSYTFQMDGNSNLGTTTKTFNTDGTLASIVTTLGTEILQDERYSFDAKNGNLAWREDRRVATNIQREEFGYNTLDQLISTIYKKNGVTLKTDEIKYKTDYSGNIDSKTGVGTYMAHGNTHRIDTISNTADSYTTNLQKITYNYLNLPSTISSWSTLPDYNNPDAPILRLSYDPLGQRNKQTSLGLVPGDPGSYMIRYYDGLYERIDYSKSLNTSPTMSTEQLFVEGENGVIAVINGGGNASPILKDYLGSFIGGVSNEASFDAWGNLRDPNNWLDIKRDLPPSSYMGYRGYLGQEHLAYYNLINLNARLYDPIMGLFVAPDNYMSHPDFRPGHNRYSYCMGNPLKYTDADGNDPLTIAILAGIGFNTIMNAREIHNIGDFLKYAAIGALSGAAGYGAGIGISRALGTASSGLGAFAHGFASGAAGGFAGGFISGAGNGIVQHNSDWFMQGIMSGGMGAALGGAMGGLGALGDYNAALPSPNISYGRVNDYSGNLTAGGDGSIGLANPPKVKYYGPEINEVNVVGAAQTTNSSITNIGYASTAISAVQVGILESRIAIPLSKRVQYSKLYSMLGSGNGYLGKLTYPGAVLSVGLDVYSLNRGDIGVKRFTYRQVGLASSIGVGLFVGGPYGGLAGGIVGGGAVAGEYMYDGANYIWNEVIRQTSTLNRAFSTGWYFNR